MDEQDQDLADVLCGINEALDGLQRKSLLRQLRWDLVEAWDQRVASRANGQIPSYVAEDGFIFFIRFIRE